MTVELTETTLCQTIEDTLKAVSGNGALSEQVTMSSKMGSPREWDSLSFVAVFAAVGETFDVDLDDDDAIHFQAVSSIFPFLNEVLEA